MTKETCYRGLIWEKIVYKSFRKNGFEIKKILTPDFVIELPNRTKVYIEVKSRIRTEKTNNPSFKISREQYNKISKLIDNNKYVIFILITDDLVSNETKILMVEASIIINALKSQENRVKKYFSLFDKDIEYNLKRNRHTDNKRHVIVRIEN